MRLETDRLILRPFEQRDLEHYAKISADPQVMQYFEHPYSFAETKTRLARYAEKWKIHGYAFAAVERKSDGRLLGKCGLSFLENDMPFTPCTEIGWRLSAEAWGQGYATEAAGAWLDWGFGVLKLSEIVAFTPVVNHQSLRVMRRLNMQRAPEMDFDLPELDDDHPLRPMAYARMTRASWQMQKMTPQR